MDRFFRHVLSLFFSCSALFAGHLKANQEACAKSFLEIIRPEKYALPTQTLKLEVANLQVAQAQDPTHSTGATLFYFPEGATVAVDARGGSVASVETTLFEPGSYDATVDGLVFSGGSTLGLASTDGVRKAIYDARKHGANAFDAIASVPGAVVYDFGGRTLPGNDPLVTPDFEIGQKLYHSLGNEFQIGRAGAGTSTTANKVMEGGSAVFGGQGAAVVETPYGKVFAAVALNPHGNIYSAEGKGVHEWLEASGQKIVQEKSQPGKNTTLSMIAFEAKLDRNQLQRMATTVHTSMAESIRPFQTYTDGDVHFSVSLHAQDLPGGDNYMVEETLQEAAREAIRKAIHDSVVTANQPIRKMEQLPSRVSRRWAESSKKPIDLVVGSVQYSIEYGLTEKKLFNKVERYLLEASEASNDVVVLPELFVFDLLKANLPESQEGAALLQMARSGQSMRVVEGIEKLAQKHDLTILAGSVPVEEGDKVMNRSFMLFPDGKRIFQDKINLTAEEKAYGFSGSKSLKTFDLPWGRSAILICYDSEFPTLSSQLIEAQPEMIFVPSLTSDKGVTRVLRGAAARSLEHHNYVVVAGAIDKDNPAMFSAQAAHFFPSDSAFAEPEVLGELNVPSVVTATWDLKKLAESRSQTDFWPGRSDGR